MKQQISTAQIIVCWDLQNDTISIPKSVKEHRIISNSEVFDFELSPEEMEQINGLNEEKRVGSDLNNFDF